MSCNCNPVNNKHIFSCECDSFVHPQKLNIGAGLNDLPRQIATFPEFVKAMLYTLRPRLLDPLNPPQTDPADVHKHALNLWKARQQDDLGVMLIEMWAYVCDSVSFYDKVIAQEEYIRTALRRPSLRKLVDLTGYLPRPAVGSSVLLTALGEGRAVIPITKGTAFRSSDFDGNPPQIFETEEEFLIHPLTSKWSVKPPQPDYIIAGDPDQLYIIPKAEIKVDKPLLLLDKYQNAKTQGLWISSSESFTDLDGSKFRKLTFADHAKLPQSYPLNALQLFNMSQLAGLWTMSVDNPALSSIDLSDNSIVLDGLYREIKSEQYILISNAKRARWFLVKSVTEVIRMLSAGEKIIINQSEFKTPGISISVTRLVLDTSINDSNRKDLSESDWNESIRQNLVVHFHMVASGTVVNKSSSVVSYSDQIKLNQPLEKPVDPFDPKLFFLSDKNFRSVKIKARIDYTSSSLLPGMDEKWSPELIVPVDAFGNVIEATRGETVDREIVGSGDATTTNQSFKLKKGPLTYFSAPTVADDNGLRSTLKVYVNGIRWTEVRGFFNKQENEEIYIVRQNDDGDSIITFGDGLRGRRLPTGTDNIIATYRFGAEEAAPPSSNITQITKGVKGLTAINNPLPAGGGADAETADNLKSEAPKSVLTLGRIVSIPDIETVCLAYRGVRAAQVEWRWHEEKQAPLIHVWYAGDAIISQKLCERLRSMADPSTLIFAEVATGKPTSLMVDIEIDPRYFADTVRQEVHQVFMAKRSGFLLPENMGIGNSLFRSKISSKALSVPGVMSVRNIHFNGHPFTAFAKNPGAGKYFDFEKGSFECK